MEIGKSFSYIFEDEKWTNKMLIGILVSIIPIVNFAWGGYVIDIIRNVSQRMTKPLPEWIDLGDKFIKGLVIAIVGFIYSLPVTIVAGIFLVATLVPALSSGSDVGEAAGAVFAGVGIGLGCLIALYLLAFSFFFPAVNIHYAHKGSFGACFQVGEIVKIVMANLSDYLVAWLATLGLGIVIGLIIGLVSAVLGWIPCIGQFLVWVVAGFGTVWASAVYAHLFGQVGARQAPISIEPA